MARDFLNRSNVFVGIDQRIWAVLESGGYGAAASGGLMPTATDAIEQVNASVDFKIPREDASHRSGRSVVTRLSGKKQVKWSFESYITPSDPDGSNHPVLPDAHPFLISAFGSVDETVATEKTYKLTRSTTSSFRMLEEGTHFSRLAVGCVADTATFTLPGDGKAMMKFEGFGQDVHMAGESLAAAPTVSGNTVTVTTGQGGRYEAGSYIDVIDGTDGSTRKASSRLVSGVTGDVLTFTGATVNISTGDIVVGAAPDFTATSSANALLGLKGTFTTALLGSFACDLLSAEIALKNNYTQKDFVYGTDAICGFIADKRRSVTVKLDILLSKDNFEFYMNNKKFLADDLTITLAPQDIPAPVNAALGRTMTFHFPKVEFNVPTLEQPSDGYIKLTLEGTALASSINAVNDEMTLKIS